MISSAGPRLEPSVAARRAGRGALSAWVASPGGGDLAVQRQIVACDPVRVVRGSSVDALERAWSDARAAWAGAPPEVPIAIGHLSYDLGRTLDRFRQTARPPTGWADLEFRFYDAVWVSEGGDARILAVDAPAAERLRARLQTADTGGSFTLGPLRGLQPDARHLAAITRVLEYVRAGDVYQVNLARPLAAAFSDEGAPIGWALAEALAREAPAPHAIWLPDEEARACLVGNSPERFLAVDPSGVIETRPIKGTRAAGAGAEELSASEKERAEHVMIVDLERNDLGRLCETGSVEVRDLLRVVSLPTVHHLVSTVRGRLRAGVGLAAILRATFPGGSITGAPKLRAMEIIDELEPARRGPYCGATGWLGAAGDLDLAVAIRTAMIRDGVLTLWVGGGIVADSIPDDELRETEAKAAAFANLSR